MANQKSKTQIRMASGVSSAFSAACSAAKIPATHRQWRKWCQGRGAAFNAKGIIA